MILVTGATGLVGLHLLKRLSREGKPIRAMYRTNIPPFLEGTNPSLIEWFQADVLDFSSLEQAFEDITHVFHCAAMVSYDCRLLESMMNINVEGTANVVNFCLSNQVSKLVHVSSIATIGKAQQGKLNTENTPYDAQEANSNYAKSKHAGEMEVWRGIAEGLQAVIVNPAVILGEGDWGKSSSNLFKIVFDEFPYYTNGVTAWVDVRDVVEAMYLLMESEITDQRFILHDGNHSFKDIFTLMAKSMGKKPPHRYASPWMSELVWRLAYLKSLLTGKVATITKETAQTAHQIQLFNNQKFLTQFPNFLYTPIEETINRVCRYYLEKATFK